MMRVICLPYAGAGAGLYRPWKGLSNGRLQAVPLQLPGREEQFSRPFYPSFAEAVADIAGRAVEAARGEPFALFGHSFGGLLAFEAARHLYDSGGPLPDHLVVSGARSPRQRGYTGLSDDDEEAVASLKQDARRGFEALDNPELRALLLPVIRADIRLLEQYGDERNPVAGPLPIPVTVLRGAADTVAGAESSTDWKNFTSADHTELEMPGGHLYLLDHMPELWRVIEEQLCP
jgi:surfactin synthase thioesterase subunit